MTLKTTGTRGDGSGKKWRPGDRRDPRPWTEIGHE